MGLAWSQSTTSKTIYIRFQYNENDVINDDSYIIDVTEENSMVMYKDEITTEIATFKQMLDAVELLSGFVMSTSYIRDSLKTDIVIVFIYH